MGTSIPHRTIFSAAPLRAKRRWGWAVASLVWLLATQGAWAGNGVQRLQNGNFSRFPIPFGTAYTIAPGTDLGAWRSGVPYVNTGTRPALGSVSIQRAAANYTATTPTTVQSTFPGDAANSVPASTTWLLYRGNATASSGAASIWFQNVSVRPSTTYVFSYYASNANAPGTSNATAPNVPVLQFQLNNVAQGANVTLANEPVNGDVWTRYTYTFTTTAAQTNVELRLLDLATGNVGDQLALTGLSLRTPSASAGGSFSCDGSLYQMRQVNTAAINGFTGNSTRLYEVIRSTTPYTTNELYDLGGTFNAAGYNSSNGYIYCLTYTGNVNPTGTDPQADRATDPTSVVELNKIGIGGIESLGTIANLPVDQWAAGTVDRGNVLYLKSQTNTSVIYKIDLSVTPLVATALNTSVAFTAYDLAYNPLDNLLYATYFPGQLYIINPSTGVVTTAGSITDNTQALGTAFFDVAGNLYAYGNGPAATTATSGRFYLINKTTGAATLINSINGATNSDGASCINPSQRIDVVKRATSVVSVSATQYDITYVAQVKNTGTITDPNVQVSDLLRGNSNNTTFPTATAVALQGSISVVNHDGSTLAPNPGFTGVSGGASLLTGTQALTAGQRATITFTVRVTFPAGSVPSTAQNNTAYATSTTTSPNSGYTQAADGTLLSPFDLVANDASTNGSTLPPSRTGLNDTGDSPSPTPVTFQPAISGNIFEDVNYGGGAGRDQASSQGISRAGVRVELYTGSGSGATYSTFTTTDANGNYSFAGLTAGSTYTVRVPNNVTNSVSSSRPTTGGSLLPVQTYVYNNVNRVGGENPGRTDAGNGTTGTTIGSLSTAAVGNTPGTVAQSIVAVTLPATTASPLLNVDFGFNFDVVTNTNNSGQGSLRQFITNSNTLGGEASLAQSGSNSLGALPVGKETSIFMIPDGLAHPGQVAGLTSGLTGGVALISPATLLPAITGPNTYLDGSTQTFNIGNTNSVTLGAGGTAGTAATALGTVNGPEVQIIGTSALPIGLDITAGGSDTNIIGLAIYGFGNIGDSDANANIRVSGASNVGISRNVVGSAATAFADPGAATRTNADGIRIVSGTGTSISNNLIGFNSGKGIETNAGVTGVSITNNEVRSNGLGNSAWDGVDVQGSASTASGNLFINNAGVGIDSFNSTGGNTISGNTVSGNGRGTATLAPNETPGVRIYGAGNTISQNIISGNYGAGVLVQSGAATSTISQNSVFNNGTVTGANGAAASGQLAIDLNTGAAATGTAPYVTVNDSGDADTGPNGLLNFPVITSATVSGTNLVVQGFARPGALIEFFNPGATADASGFGEGQTYLGSFTEGSAADLNTGTGAYSGTVNGLNQGADNTNRFTFVIPLSGSFAAYAAGSLLTSTATLGGATSEFSGNVAVNTPPVPNTLSNVSIPNTNGATVLSPNLSAATSGTGNNISYYTVTALPASGTLTYNGTVLTAGNIGSTQIANPALLTYTPVAGYAGGSVNFSYTATDANGIVSTTNNNGGTITNGPATYTIPVSQVADVATTITPTPSGTVNAGGTLTFAVTYLNDGPNTAAGFTRTLSLTSGLGAANVVVRDASNNIVAGAYNNTNGTITLPALTSLGDGLTSNFTVSIASVPASVASVTLNSTVGTTTGQGADTGPNSASSTVTVTPVADVATTITGPTQVIPGSSNTYTATFTNNGPSTAAAVNRTVTLPTGATLSAAQVSSLNTTYGLTGNGLNTGSYSTTGSGNSAVTTINFGALATQASGGTAAFSFAFTAPTAAGSATLRSNTSTATSQNGATANDQATLNLNVAGAAFSCNSALYRLRQLGSNNSFLERLDRTGTTSSALTYTAVTLYDAGIGLNALAFNFQDGYLYAFGENNNRLYRLSSTGFQDLGLIAGLPTTGFNSAAADQNGNVYLANNATNMLYKYNLSTGAVATITLSQTINFGDLSLNPADGFLYTTRFYSTTGSNGLFRINPATGAVTLLGTPATSGDNMGANYFDAAGTCYGTTNQGSLVTFSTSTGAAAAIGTLNTTGGALSTASLSDGASCVFSAEDIDVVQTAGTPVRLSATTFNIPFTVQVKNTGTVVDPNVQVNDFLTSLFPTASSISVSGLTASGGLTAINAAFTGQGSNTGLLSGSQTLAVGATATINYTVQVSFPAGSVPTTTQFDQAFASTVATGPNAGWALVNGTPVPPTLVLGGDRSTNSATLPATAGADAASPTPVLLNQPLANNVTNVPVANTSPAVVLNPNLSATAVAPNTISTYTVNPVSSGTLFFNGTPVTAATTVPAASLSLLTYQPTSGFSGNATFSYSATDNAGGLSNVATYTIPVTAVADVATTLSGPASITAGVATSNFTVTFSNNGPNAADNVTRIVTLPPGATMTTAQVTASGGTYTAPTSPTTSGTLNFGNLASLASGASSTFTFAFVPFNGNATPASTVSTITTTTGQNGATANDQATVNSAVQFVPVANNDSQAANAGTTITIDVVANDTDGNGNNTIVASTIDLDPNTPGQQTVYIVNNTINQELYRFTLLPSGLVQFTPTLLFTVGTAMATYTVQDNTGLVSNVASITVPIGTVADVTTTITPAPSPVNAGGTLTYNVTYRNTGPSDATGLGRTLSLTAGLGAANVTVRDASNNIIPGAYDNAFGTITLPAFGTLASGATTADVTISIANVPASFTSLTANSAVSTTTSQGVNLATDNASSTVTVTPVADVSTTLSGPTALTAGQPTGTYTVTFANNGPSTASGVTRTVTLPGGSTMTSAQQAALPAGASYNSGTNVIDFGFQTTWTAGSSNTYTFAFTAPNNSGASVAITSNIATTTSENGAIANNSATVNSTIAPVADVTTVINGPTQLSAGLPTGTFTASFVNEGPATANGVTRTVQLPVGSTMTAAQIAALPAGATYTAGTRVIDFGTLTILASGASSTVSFTFTASPATGVGSVSSTTSTTSSEGTNIAPNTSVLAVNVNDVADVQVSNTPSAATVTAGQPASFTVTFSNNGPSTASGVVRTVQLPAGLTAYGPVTASNGGTYNNATGLVTYSPSPTTIDLGVPQTSVISFTMPPSGAVTATAAVSTTTYGANQTGNNTATATISSSAAFDLASTLTGPSSVLQGDLVTLNVTTTNNGPSVAPSPVQTVQLQTGLSTVFVSNGGSYNSGTGVVTFPTLVNLASGQSATQTVSFVAQTPAFQPSATATSATNPAGDTNPSNNTAYLNGSVTPVALPVFSPTTDLANVYTTIASSVSSTTPGGPITLTVVVGNNGPDAANNVVTTVQLLPGFGVGTLTVGGQTGTLSGNTLSFANGASYDIATGLVSFPAVATQVSGTSQTYTIGLVAPANVGNNGQLLATAATHFATSDPMPANNVASVVVSIAPLADLTTTIVGPATTAAGQPVSYTATFTNNGPSAATSVVQTAQLPLGLSNVTVLNGAGVPLAGAYDPATGLVTFPIVARRTSGVSQSFTINFTAPTNTFAVSSAVSSATPDSNPANNAASVTTTVTPSADVAVAVSGPAVAVIGNAVTYAVTSLNNGPSTATGVVPTLQLPAGLTIVSNSAGATYSASGLVTFATTSLLTGGSVRNYITFLMPSPASGQIAGTAAVTSSTADPITTNNSQSTQTSVAPATTTSANIATSINPSSTTIAAGAPLYYGVNFSNAGPDAAINVTPQVFLPAGLDVTNVDNGGSYNATTGVVTWPTIASLPNGGLVSYTIYLNAPAGGPLRALSVTASSTSDPVPANNTATAAAVTITPVFDATTSLGGPTTALPGATNIYTVTTLNSGPSAATSVTQTVTLPAGVTATNISGGGTQTGTIITFPAVANQAPGANGQVNNTFTVTMPATGSLALSASVTATGETNTGNNTATLTTTHANQLPVAANVVNALQTPRGETAGPLLISPLLATDADGTIASYTITAIPAAGQGTLLYNNGGTYTAVTNGQVLTPAQAATLQFDPTVGFSGNAFFSYTATDNVGGISTAAVYTVPVGPDTPALYTVAPVRGGAGNMYQNGDALATVFDVNGGAYNAAGTITNNGIGSAVLNSGTLPAGTALNPATGQIAVTDRSLLVPGSYPLTITTTDLYGGVTVHNITLVIGGSPIAIDDFATTALNTAVTFAVAANDLANGGAAIAPATIDLDLNTPGIQASITTALGTFTTTGAPAGSVTFTPASATFSGTATTPYTIQNTAGATSNQANLVVTVSPDAAVDLSTSLTAVPNPVNAGSPTTVTVTATNNGTTTAANVVQTVLLPAGLTTAGLTVGGQTGTPAGNTISFANGASYNTSTGLLSFASQSIAANATQTFPAVAFTAPASTLTVTAQVGNGTADPNPANNVASITLVVTPQFDLATTLSGPTSVVTGGAATFTVTSTNAGPSAVANAVQTVQLPTGLAGVYATNGGTYNSGNGTVTFPATALASGQTVVNSVSFAVLASSFSPSAQITPNTTGAGDINTANNTAYLNGAASLTAVTVTGATGTPATSTTPLSGTVANTYVSLIGPASVTPGQTNATYTITQGNNGPTAATNVLTQVSVPTGLTPASLTIDGQTGNLSGGIISFANGATYNVATGVVSLAIIASQPSAAVTTSTIVLTAPTTGGSYSVTASVSAATSDPMAGNNVAMVVTTIQPVADLTIRLTGPATALAGQVLTYAVTVENTAGTAASAVRQSVDLPAGLSAATLTVGGQTGTLSGSTVSFANGATYNVQTGELQLGTIASLGAGASLTTPISFPAPAGAGAVSLAATVSSTTPDANAANNASTVSTTLTPQADVTVTIAGPASVTAGNPVTYAVTTASSGPSTTSATTTVQLPTGLSGVVVRDNAGNVVAGAYNTGTGLVTFPTLTALAPGTAGAQTGTITFNAPDAVRIDVAAVSSVPAGSDANLSNNTASAVTTVSPQTTSPADLVVSLVPNVTTQTAGSPVVYTLTTTNNGPNSATNVAQQVSLPTGLTTTTVLFNGTTGTPSGNIITFTGGATYNTTTGLLTLPAVAGPLASAGVLSNTITVTTNQGPLLASATVAAANADPNTTNNTAQATNVTITPRTDLATFVTGPATATDGGLVSYGIVTANNGPSAATNVLQTVTLPANLSAADLRLNGQAGTPAAGTISFPGGASYNTSSGVLTYTVASLVSGGSTTSTVAFIAPAQPSFTVSGSVPTTNDVVPANNTSTLTTTRSNQPPVAQDVVNTFQSPEGNTSTKALPISTLAATDADGSVATYQLLSIPNAATQGVLYYGTTAITSTNFAALNLTPGQAMDLRFDPVSTFVGSVTFLYTATDNLGAVSAPARYTIQVGNDNASVYTNAPTRGNTTPYTTGDVISSVFDANGGAYSAAAAVTDNGVRNAIVTGGTLPAGVSIDPATGLIYVSDASQMVNTPNATQYTVTITTTDVFGGVTTQPVTFTIGAYPLPVELTMFEAKAVNNVDALLSWTTASERDNDHFEVERSANGRDFVKVGEKTGQGTTSMPTHYTLTDAGIGRQLSGVVYYRLKQVDRSGAASYSPVRTVTFTKATTPVSFSLYPNPATSETVLDLSQLPAGTYQVSVLDATGREIRSQQLQAGLTHRLSVRELATGAYFVVVRGNSNGQSISLTQRLLKN